MKGWKTVLLGVLLIATSVLSTPEMQAFVADHLPWLGSAIGTVIIVLRALTNSPVFKKSE
jgi:hypothetical protein